MPPATNLTYGHAVAISNIEAATANLRTEIIRCLPLDVREHALVALEALRVAAVASLIAEPGRVAGNDRLVRLQEDRGRGVRTHTNTETE